MDDRELQQRVARVETLLTEIEALPEGRARSAASEAIQGLIMLYGEGLARLMDLIMASNEEEEFAEVLAEDELIAHLLLVHGLHPFDVATRVQRSLDKVRPYLESHGGNVEILDIDGSVARLRMEGSCSGCPSSLLTLKSAIEEAVLSAAPELDSVIAEGINDNGETGRSPSETAWSLVEGLDSIDESGLLVKQVAGAHLLFLKSGQHYYAYEPRCPSCTQSLDHATLAGAELSCPGCGSRYNVRQAGRGLDGDVHLRPVPLLAAGNGAYRIAVQSKVS